MLIRLDGRVALVSGAAQGIGRAIATALGEAGARLHLTDVDATGLAGAAATLGAAQHVADLGERAAAHHVVAEVQRQEGRLDILVCAAGGVRGQVGRPLEEIGEADWHAIFRANVDGAMWLAQAAAPGMREAGWGRIVTISSGAGLRPSLTRIQAYTAAKHALVGLTKQLALELGPSGVTVNSVAPGFVLSNPSTMRQWESYGAEGQRRMVESIHTRRLGKAEDIAAAALFFCSEQAEWITGQALSVDGGRA
jgi:3-oxoacyl-[acyl-carrier protein] reductase